MLSRIKAYFNESYSEIRKVNWPTRSETVNLTMVVIFFSLVVAVFLGLLDIVFSYFLVRVI